MARTERVLTIFLASPSDVSDERAVFEEVVNDWNKAWARELGLRLELLRWETDAFPAIGTDAQDVINRQIPNDYDLFFGIMWSRFGTPTGRFGSGTEEEFHRALERCQIANERPEIAFYFKDAPISPSKLDTHQLERVQKFKREASDFGLLTWDFVDIGQFEKLVRLHITRHVQAWRKSQEAEPLTRRPDLSVSIVSELTQAPPPAPDEDTDDFGYLDYLEDFADRSAEMTEIAERLTKAQQELTDQTKKGTNELDALQANPESASAKQVRRAIARVADEMNRFTVRVETEIPLYRVAVDRSMNALINAATITAELYPEQVKSTKEAAVQLLTTLISARQSTEGFLTATTNLPRMTKELNVAKRKQAAALESLISEFENSEGLLVEALSVISGL